MELGKIEKPEVKSFAGKSKLYVVPTLPFEELALQFNLDAAKVERFWLEVSGKIDYFISTYGDISVLYLEGVNDDEKIGIEFFEKFGKEGSHYKLIKSLVDKGAKLRGIDRSESTRKSRLVFEEYSKSFLPEIEEIHKGFYGKDIDFDRWREYLAKRIQEIQDEMGRLALKIISEMPENTNGVLIITDGRPIEFPQGMDVFQIRPPAFDELAKSVSENMK